MKIYKEEFQKKDLPVFQQNFLTEDMLLFDIETTGLSPAKHQIYCIGCGYADIKNVTIELFFAESPDDELLILENFLSLLNQYGTIVTFNGTTFDIPYIKKRTELLSKRYAPHIFNTKKSYDLYREVKSMKSLLQLPSYNQKSVEQFLGCCREDQYNGGELIKLYQEYIKQPDQKILDLLLLHNFEDIKGMFHLLGILSYQQYTKEYFEIADIITETDENLEYLNIKLIPEHPLPQSIHRVTEHVSFLLDTENALLRFPVHHGILKHFFPDPENYYYLPEEDTAVHKSVGEYVDPSHRKKATKKNCYIKKECDYILIPTKSEHNLLQQEYNDNSTYLEIPPQNMKALKEFIQKLFHLYIK